MSILSQCLIKIEHEQALLLSVSNSAISPKIAICTMTRVLLYTENGQKMTYELARKEQPTAIEWHPFEPTLVIGWKNGTVTFWYDDKSEAKEETSAHKECVNLIQHNNSGSRMVTADLNGLIIVWKGINPICTYQREGKMTICVFADLNNVIKSQNLFFFGGVKGFVCLADDSKRISEVCRVKGSIKSLLIYEKQNSVIIITSGLVLVQFRISQTEKSQPDKQLKLSISGEVDSLQSTWIGSCLVGISSNENMIRMWHLETDENYMMTLHDVQEFNQSENILNDKITCIGYNRHCKYLVAGTREGKIVFWKNNRLIDESPQESEEFQAIPYIDCHKSIEQIVIGKNNGLVVARGQDQVMLIQEVVVHGRLQQDLRILQIDPNRILIYMKNQEVMNKQLQEGGKEIQTFQFEAKMNIKSIDCTSQFLMIQGSDKIEIHEFSGKQISIKSTIEIKCLKSAIYNEDLILVYEQQIDITNFKGVSKQIITFSESDGTIISIQLMGKHLVVWTSNSYFRIYDLGRREIRQVGVNRKFENLDGPLGSIRKCAINNDGTKVGILADNQTTKLDRFYVYDSDIDKFQYYELPQHRAAVDLQWDQNDSRFFCVLTMCTMPKSNEEDQPLDFRNKKLMTFFYNTQIGIKEQDQYTLEKNQESLFAVRVPHLYIINRVILKDQTSSFRIHEQLLNEFNGLEKADDSTKRAVIDFSFHLASGNLDEAYKSVKSIQNPTVWEKMAQMSVKSRRLDVAEICIGNMRFARGAKAIRETKKEPEYEAQLAMVAIQLNMINEAEKLYQQCKRYDLLNKLYQAKGDWTQALDIAQKHDRINLKSTYYKMARQFEITKDYDQAIQYYELSGNSVKEVPRMFLEAEEIPRLEDYINSKKDAALFKWWGNYLESQEKFEDAMKYYRQGNDTLGIVRILLFQNNIRMAKDICNDKQDPAAYYYLARQLEQMKIIPESINYYAKAQYYAEAVRLAKSQNMISEVQSISLLAPQQVMIQSARYFEQKSKIEAAVLLYMKGGQLKKALELAKKQNLSEYVRKINQQLAQMEQQQPSMLSSNQVQFDQRPQARNNLQVQRQQSSRLDKQAAGPVPGSLQDLITRKEYLKVLDTCEQQGIPITEDLVKQITEEMDEKRKKEFMLQVAERCKKMGNFEQASKMYIAIGEKVKAMKALCKLGDTDKIVAFANNARMAEIYILAGNFLQTGEWHKTPELMKNIMQFYSKAKAFDHLAVFFDACSTVEIDEYRDYEKACAALKEAIKHSEKSGNQAKTQQLKQKLQYIDMFVQAKQSEPQQMIRVFSDLLANPNIEYAVRQGDIHAEIVEFYYSQKMYEKAFDEMQKMQKKSIVLNPYLDQELIQTVMNYMKSKGGVQNQQQKQQQQQDVDDFQEEEVIDDNI